MLFYMGGVTHLGVGLELMVCFFFGQYLAFAKFSIVFCVVNAKYLTPPPPYISELYFLLTSSFPLSP